MYHSFCHLKFLLLIIVTKVELNCFRVISRIGFFFATVIFTHTRPNYTPLSYKLLFTYIYIIAKKSILNILWIYGSRWIYCLKKNTEILILYNLNGWKKSILCLSFSSLLVDRKTLPFKCLFVWGKSWSTKSLVLLSDFQCFNFFM